MYLTGQDSQVRNPEKGKELVFKSVERSPKNDGLDAWAEACFQSGDRIKALETIHNAAGEVDYPPNRHSYLRKQLLRFRKGEQDSSPPALTWFMLC